MARFIRLVREKEKMEVLFNVDAITKIEVKYGVRSTNPDDTMLYGVTLREGLSNPEAIRSYNVFVGGESFLLPGDGDDPVIRVIQQIYENAIRAPESHEAPPQTDA